jgi:23S rRNA G2445 N2-methylase RlmL
MARKPQEPSVPACYALVQPGLELVAGAEIERDLGGAVKKTGRGWLVFRLPRVDQSILTLRTVEDVFLLAWGTDKLTYRAVDLGKIEHWTAREANWSDMLRIHNTIRSRPSGKTTYHLVTQMEGHHGYRRIDAQEAMARGLAGKVPAAWRPVNEDAAVEFWLTIYGTTAFCGLRLSDRTMRHRRYKLEHIAASLRPTVAAAMVRLADIKPHQWIVDPMCGAGTILAEVHGFAKRFRAPIGCLGADLDRAALRAAGPNLRSLGQTQLLRADARSLPLEANTADRIISNPPFGKQLSRPGEIGRLYENMVREANRVLKQGGRVVYLVSDLAALKKAVSVVGWQAGQTVRIRVLGQAAVITTWLKP